MIKAYNFSVFGQGLLDIAIKVGVAAVVLLVNALSSAVTNGSLQLPDPAISVPVITILLSQLDSYVVAWQAKENPPAV